MCAHCAHCVSPFSYLHSVSLSAVEPPIQSSTKNCGFIRVIMCYSCSLLKKFKSLALKVVAVAYEISFFIRIFPSAFFSRIFASATRHPTGIHSYEVTPFRLTCFPSSNMFSRKAGIDILTLTQNIRPRLSRVRSIVLSRSLSKTFNYPLAPDVMPRAAGFPTMFRLPSQPTSDGLDACFLGIPMDNGTYAHRTGAR